MARRLLLLVAAVAALSGSAPAIAVVSGEQGLLVTFFRASSFGRVSFTSTVTPWVRAYGAAPACNPLIAAGLQSVASS